MRTSARTVSGGSERRFCTSSRSTNCWWIRTFSCSNCEAALGIQRRRRSAAGACDGIDDGIDLDGGGGSRRLRPPGTIGISRSRQAPPRHRVLTENRPITNSMRYNNSATHVLHAAMLPWFCLAVNHPGQLHAGSVLISLLASAKHDRLAEIDRRDRVLEIVGNQPGDLDPQRPLDFLRLDDRSPSSRSG